MRGKESEAVGRDVVGGRGCRSEAEGRARVVAMRSIVTLLKYFIAIQNLTLTYVLMPLKATVVSS